MSREGFRVGSAVSLTECHGRPWHWGRRVAVWMNTQN